MHFIFMHFSPHVESIVRSAFDINLLAPVPIITAVQTMCKAQGWCAEAALQGTAR